ncbi:MAG: thiamine pyrophosphate-dependent dehydrogenase E1 component subunit alpha [Patescibacteria group bacterium]
MRKKLNIELYKKLFLIRSAETAIIAHYQEDEMKTPMHMSMGGEAISVGVCFALGDRGAVYGTYRSHALYLSMTGETDAFFGELYGRATGVARGKAGSMHLSAPEHGFMGASAIVGSTIPLAVGSAFASRMLKTKKIAAVFFGDGAVDEGVFWESLNLACVMRLPVVFVYEDNGLAVHATDSERHGYQSIGRIVGNFDCKVFASRTTDVEKIYELSRRAITHAERKQMPVFLHFQYYRYLEHVGVNEDFGAGYRDRAEFLVWRRKDPVLVQRRKLISLGISEAVLMGMEKRIDRQVSSSIVRAQKAPFPKVGELTNHIFSE